MLSKFETAWSSIQGVLDGFDGLAADSRLSALSGLNDTNLSTLNTQGQLIRESAEGIIQSLNAKYGEEADYTADGMPRTLLMEYVRYARDSALDVFENNFQALLLGMQNGRRVNAYDLESAVPPQR